MQKGLLSFCLLILSLPVLAQDELPDSLIKYYQASVDESHDRIWLRKERPELEYSNCLDKQTSGEQRIIVMCGNFTEISEPDTGSFDIWYLKGDTISARETTQGYGRMGTSGSAKAVKIGEKWGVVLESSYMLQGYEQTFQQFYIAEGKDIHLIASLPTHSSNRDSLSNMNKQDDVDDLDTQVTFSPSGSDGYSDMLLHSTGLLNGEKINKRWSVKFDVKSNQYPIPERINIGY
ncbi:TPA: hypothetical protein OOF41_002386 [Citrobacter freundii]|uniref:hypothetical protein n=1 Tax=Citrobacter freundii TaxID=546 RepID=UPI003979A926|nr:hypothetical protein [Citrobacter freundii]HCR4044197.1 hypothetical protein [Citrobacter freundii]